MCSREIHRRKSGRQLRPSECWIINLFQEQTECFATTHIGVFWTTEGQCGCDDFTLLVAIKIFILSLTAIPLCRRKY
ncbi:hypothetical protein PUN28_001065 [Cardiocondyla obscurior]|uniref:Uncharacterized protein n=1 Tax=Cardiocondyla obscurior TaxID=286306 RepID=A0AAW2H2Q2_9HYME